MAKTSRKGPSRKPRAEKKAPRGKRSATKTAARSDAEETPHGKGSRSIWTGSISFGLVQIPVRLLGAEILRFSDELAPLKSVSGDFPGDVKASAKEVALAEQLVESLRGKWDPAKYKDVYRSELLSAIEHKAKTGKLPAQRKAPAKSNITDLVTLLQKSVARSGKHRAA